jgi:hypothetical protein
MAYAVDGMEGNDTAALKTVRNCWNCFSAGWRRKNPEIPTSIAESVTNVCLFHDSLNTFQSRMLTTNKFYLWPVGRGDEATSQKEADEVRQQVSPASLCEAALEGRLV